MGYLPYQRVQDFFHQQYHQQYHSHRFFCLNFQCKITRLLRTSLYGWKSEARNRLIEKPVHFEAFVFFLAFLERPGFVKFQPPSLFLLVFRGGPLGQCRRGSFLWLGISCPFCQSPSAISKNYSFLVKHVRALCVGLNQNNPSYWPSKETATVVAKVLKRLQNGVVGETWKHSGVPSFKIQKMGCTLWKGAEITTSKIKKIAMCSKNV